ncbi:HPr family phosphocarrier protein [Sinanaerobacter chloroacetimidivorans]|jgi:phosphocarrier protein HPr|uniref:Phosphocarrier protein HPr n=1 Tax=Sinanaerobacter chloroacetimidivorans TaxID=2818044 RepID=A0A8J8B3F1_9FIRM|nr:HPr family phosphocarrier protein [Sinanaerobacter chloroacetimidivorans]MBR0598255.1 HPr family phosphocarrier protein [Sinanaerobacter chloroacetimidivorans]
MFEKQIIIQNPTGLHARPAAQLTALCKGYTNNITILFGEMKINPKSIIGLLSAGVKKGSEVVIQVEGPDEDKVGNEIVEFLENLDE